MGFNSLPGRRPEVGLSGAILLWILAAIVAIGIYWIAAVNLSDPMPADNTDQSTNKPPDQNTRTK